MTDNTVDLTPPSFLDRRPSKSQIIQTSDNAPDELTEKINAKHKELKTSVRTTIGLAVELGTLLKQKKATLKHGEWGAWLEQNPEISDRTARVWMQLASAVEDGTLPKTVSDADLTVSAVRKLIAKPRTKTSTKMPGPHVNSHSPSKGAVLKVCKQFFKQHSKGLTAKDRAWILDELDDELHKELDRETHLTRLGRRAKKLGMRVEVDHER